MTTHATHGPISVKGAPLPPVASSPLSVAIAPEIVQSALPSPAHAPDLEGRAAICGAQCPSENPVQEIAGEIASFEHDLAALNSYDKMTDEMIDDLGDRLFLIRTQIEANSIEQSDYEPELRKLGHKLDLLKIKYLYLVESQHEYHYQTTKEEHRIHDERQKKLTEKRTELQEEPHLKKGKFWKEVADYSSKGKTAASVAALPGLFCPPVAIASGAASTACSGVRCFATHRMMANQRKGEAVAKEEMAKFEKQLDASLPIAPSHPYFFIPDPHHALETNPFFQDHDERATQNPSDHLKKIENEISVFENMISSAQQRAHIPPYDLYCLRVGLVMLKAELVDLKNSKAPLSSENADKISVLKGKIAELNRKTQDLAHHKVMQRMQKLEQESRESLTLQGELEKTRRLMEVTNIHLQRGKFLEKGAHHGSSMETAAETAEGVVESVVSALGEMDGVTGLVVNGIKIAAKGAKAAAKSTESLLHSLSEHSKSKGEKDIQGSLTEHETHVKKSQASSSQSSTPVSALKSPVRWWGRLPEQSIDLQLSIKRTKLEAIKHSIEKYKNQDEISSEDRHALLGQLSELDLEVQKLQSQPQSVEIKRRLLDFEIEIHGLKRELHKIEVKSRAHHIERMKQEKREHAETLQALEWGRARLMEQSPHLEEARKAQTKALACDVGMTVGAATAIGGAWSGIALGVGASVAGVSALGKYHYDKQARKETETGIRHVEAELEDIRLDIEKHRIQRKAGSPSASMTSTSSLSSTP